MAFEIKDVTFNNLEEFLNDFFKNDSIDDVKELLGLANIKGSLNNQFIRIFKKIDEFQIVAGEIVEFFECYDCGECCKWPVYLEDEDLERLYAKVGKDVVDNVTKDENGAPMLKHPCPYRSDTERCTVYEHRPTVCRYYPFSAEFMLPGLCLCKMGKDIMAAYEEFAGIDILTDDMVATEYLQEYVDNIDSKLNEINKAVNSGERMRRAIIPLNDIICFKDHLKRLK